MQLAYFSCRIFRQQPSRAEEIYKLIALKVDKHYRKALHIIKASKKGKQYSDRGKEKGRVNSRHNGCYYSHKHVKLPAQTL